MHCHARIATSAAIATILALSLNAQSASATPEGNAGSAAAALRQSLECIAESDSHFNAVLALDPTRAAAEAALEDSRDGSRPSLSGMPELLKDNIAMAGLPTTAGSLALAGNIAAEDAPLVTGLRAAGTIILGKTNLSEWANFRSEHSSSGWSGVDGQTGNAVDPARSPCGSSSGSGVAVARGYVAMAVGTETSGSIVCPAAINGVVGFKPTHGLVSGEGIVPLALSQDTAGPIANSVATAALSLAAMSTADSAEADAVRAGLADYDSLEDFHGLRVGVLARTQGFDVRRDQALEAVLATLRRDGATLIPDLAIDHYPEFGSDSYDVLLYEFRRDINAYLATAPAGVASRALSDLIAFNEAEAARELAVFDQSIFLRARDLPDDDAAYQEKRARIRRATREDGLDRLFSEYQLDAIIGITTGPAWMIDPVNGDAFFGPGMARDAAIAGNPHVTLPLAEVDGLPLGISLWGQRWQDHELARMAQRLEELHPAPEYAWTVPKHAACLGP